MGGDMNDPEIPVCKEHGIVTGFCIMGVYLGMSGELVATRMYGLFVNWSGNGAVNLAGHGEFDRLFYKEKGRCSGFRCYLSIGDGMNIRCFYSEHIHGAGFEQSF